MSFSLPPAVRLAERLSATIEAAVDGSGFKRKHRYTFGARLRMQAWDVLSTANRAARRPEKRAALLDDLKDQVDDIKLANAARPRRFDYRLEGRRITIKVT